MKEYEFKLYELLQSENLSEKLSSGKITLEESVNKLTVIQNRIAVDVLPKKQTSNSSDWYKQNKNEIKKSNNIKQYHYNKWKANKTNKKNYDNYKQSKLKAKEDLKAFQRRYWEDFYSELKTCWDSGSSHNFNKLLKTEIGITSTAYRSGKCGYKNEVFDEEDKIITDECEILERWKRYYEKLLNHKAPIGTNIDEYLPTQTENVQFKFDEPFSSEEVIAAIKRCKNNKKVGPDEIPIECIKTLLNFGEDSKEKKNLYEYIGLITMIINKILESGSVPEIWKDVIISVIAKPGDSRNCVNSRGISLQSHLGKLLELCIEARLTELLKHILYGVNETQFGCMAGRGTDDALLLSNIIANSAIEKNINLYKCYIDLVKAYDTVNRDLLFEILKRRGVPPKLLEMIQGLYHNINARVRINGKLSSPFKLTVGVKQGGVLSGLLWCIYMGAIIELTHNKYRENNLNGINMIYSTDSVKEVSGKKHKTITDNLNIYEVLFVDDWLMMALSMSDLTKMMEIVYSILTMFGLSISWPKTQMMIVKRKKMNRNETGEVEEKLFVQNKCIEQVLKFKYLGVTENDIANMELEIEKRMLAMRIAFQKYKRRIFMNKLLSISIKLRIYTVMVSTAGLYGSALWSLTKQQTTKLEALNLKFLKIIVPKMNIFSSYEDVIIEAAQHKCIIIPIECQAIKRGLMFLGHVERMNPHNIQIKILHSEINKGTKKSGAPLVGYKNSICKKLNQFGIRVEEANELMKDRAKWRNKIHMEGSCYFISNWLRVRRVTRDKKYLMLTKQINENDNANNLNYNCINEELSDNLSNPMLNNKNQDNSITDNVNYNNSKKLLEIQQYNIYKLHVIERLYKVVKPWEEILEVWIDMFKRTGFQKKRDEKVQTNVILVTTELDDAHENIDKNELNLKKNLVRNITKYYPKLYYNNPTRWRNGEVSQSVNDNKPINNKRKRKRKSECCHITEIINEYDEYPISNSNDGTNDNNKPSIMNEYDINFNNAVISVGTNDQIGESVSLNSESDTVSNHNEVDLEVCMTHKQKQNIRNKERYKRKRKLNTPKVKI